MHIQYTYTYNHAQSIKALSTNLQAASPRCHVLVYKYNVQTVYEILDWATQQRQVTAQEAIVRCVPWRSPRVRSAHLLANLRLERDSE